MRLHRQLCPVRIRITPRQVFDGPAHRYRIPTKHRCRWWSDTDDNTTGQPPRQSTESEPGRVRSTTAYKPPRNRKGYLGWWVFLDHSREKNFRSEYSSDGQTVRHTPCRSVRRDFSNPRNLQRADRLNLSIRTERTRLFRVIAREKGLLLFPPRQEKGTALFKSWNWESRKQASPRNRRHFLKAGNPVAEGRNRGPDCQARRSAKRQAHLQLEE